MPVRGPCLLAGLTRGCAASGRGRHSTSLLIDHLPRMATKEPSGRELTELVPDHVFRDVDGDELVPVVNGERVPDEVWDHRARARPRLHHTLLVAAIQHCDLLEQALMYVRALFQTSRHVR